MLNVPEVMSDILLEVIIVIENHEGVSIWYKSDYNLNAVPVWYFSER
jgi:hypothetical protein